MKAQQIWPGLSPREWTATERRAVGLIRGGRSLEEAAAEAKADVERVKAAWAIHAATPEGKAHAAANARVRVLVLGAEERAKVEAELKARDGAPGLRAEVEQLRQRLAKAEGLAAIEQQGREAAEREFKQVRDRMIALDAELGAARKARADTDREMRFRVEANQAHERADAADDEVRRLTSEGEVLRGLLDDQRKLREQTEERLRVEEQQAMKAEARADTAEAEVQRLAGELRGLKDLAVAMRELSGTRAIRDLTDDDYRTSGEVGLRPQDLAALTPERASRFIEGARRRQADAAQIQSILAAVARIEAAIVQPKAPAQPRAVVEVSKKLLSLPADESAKLNAKLKRSSGCRRNGCFDVVHARGLCRYHYVPAWAEVS